MHELAIENFKRAGFILPETFDPGETILADFGEGETEIYVAASTVIQDHGRLYLPIDPQQTRKLMETVFSTMGD